jgi:hypothetical protein
MAYDDDEDNVDIKEDEEDNEDGDNEDEDNVDGIDEKDQRIKELEEELEKEKNKEKNFKNLKEAEKGKRKKIADRVADMEALINQEREDRQKLQSSIMRDAEQVSLEQLAGDDKDLRQKLEDRVKNSEAYLGAPADSKELVDRYEKAFEFLEGTRKKVNPLHAYSPVTGQQSEQPREKGFTQTQEGKAIFEAKFAKEIEKVKQINPKFKI